jgi:CheY-like chemotaxis protein
MIVAQAGNRSGTHRLGKTKVLLIDDSEVARTGMRALLTRAKMEVFEQASAIGATRAIIQHQIDVVLVDVSMPGLSGDKLVRLLRDNPRLEGLVIVLVSAECREELEAIAAAAGADAVVSKTQLDEDLVGVLKMLVASSAVRTGARSAAARLRGGGAGESDLRLTARKAGGTG